MLELIKFETEKDFFKFYGEFELEGIEFSEYKEEKLSGFDSEKGFVDGDAPDAVLARAEYYLEQKRLGEAVKELEKLDGKCAQYLEGFMKKAKDRLIAEQMFNVLKSHYMNQIEKIQ